jgi:broad specificity phosphatase PhoE
VPTTIVMVRHGETDWNRERRFQGRADQPLHEAGRGQARDLAELLHGEPVSAVYTSPLRRACETAEILAGNFGLRPQPLDALLEIDVGAWEGRTIDEVRATYPGRAEEDWRSGWDEGETYDELSRRVVPTLMELGTKHEGGHVLVVTHAGPLRAAIAAAMGLSYDDARPLIGPLENCAVFRFAVQDGTIEAVD